MASEVLGLALVRTQVRCDPTGPLAMLAFQQDAASLSLKKCIFKCGGHLVCRTGLDLNALLPHG